MLYTRNITCTNSPNISTFINILFLNFLGFEESKKGCCGSGELEIGPLCNRKSVICADDSKYVFWDSFHPTEKTYEILVDEIIKENLSLLL